MIAALDRLALGLCGNSWAAIGASPPRLRAEVTDLTTVI